MWMMKNKSDKLRVGVIGVGYLGRFHAEKFSVMDDVDLVGVVDIDKSQSEEIATLVHTRAYQDYKELYNRVNAVSIVTPTPGHFLIAKDFLEHDIDVMIEKPITGDIDQAEELIHIAKSRGRIIQVGHLERFNPAFVSAKKMVEHPLFIESSRKSIYQPRGTDVSVVLDLMIHDIDLVLSLVNSEITDVKAAGLRFVSEHLDAANARIEFANGCVANISASRIALLNERKMVLYQQHANIFIDFANHETTVLKRENAVQSGQIPGVGAETHALPKGDALKDELVSFVRSVKMREIPIVSGEMGRDALQTALDIMDKIKCTKY
jgi:predicted dehydrogenase